MAVNILEIIEWALIVFLVVLSGLFSGLNLGLMGLDMNGLKIVESGPEPNATYARRIKPLRQNGNWLLCTLLLGNVAVNAALSILLAEKSSGLAGFFISTGLIVLFGEIIPQALCSRYALIIGCKTRFLVWPLMFIMGILAYPISLCLDWLLGDEVGIIYSNRELQKLIDIHAQEMTCKLDGDTANMLKGALGLYDKRVADVMTNWKDVFKFHENTKLSFDVMTLIFKSGHSRIPVVRSAQENNVSETVLGILYAKDLILIDPDDELPVTQIMSAFAYKTPPSIAKEAPLQDALQVFIKTATHIAIVVEYAADGARHLAKSVPTIEVNPVRTRVATTSEFGDYELKSTGSISVHKNRADVFDKVVVGIITLEDVIEHILQTQLIDEHDIYIDSRRTTKTQRYNNINWNLLQMFDHRQRVLTSLPPQELQAVYSFLSQSVNVFRPQNRLVSESAFKNLLAASHVTRVILKQEKESGAAEFMQLDPYKDIESNGVLLYERNKKTDYFTLLLDGKCEIFAGRQGFRSELSRWTYLCPDALNLIQNSFVENKPIFDYVPDFTCKITENSRVLRIKFSDFVACLQGKFDFENKKEEAKEPDGLRKDFSAADKSNSSIKFDSKNAKKQHIYRKNSASVNYGLKDQVSNGDEIN